MEQGDQIQERYVLEESLGRGDMAEVWRARDRNLDRPVAIKFLAPQLSADPEFLVRFFSEAQSVAGLSHPNVVSVLDFGEEDGSPYLVMEYVPRGAVTELTGEPLQPERAAEIVRDAARGAGAAHEKGIVHRDIKPGNILLCDDGRAELADFGIALTAFSEKLTATGQVIGSPHYIAPEQAAGKGSRPESDVYALGVVLYELLTGHPPFEADNATAIAIAHVDREPEPPSKDVPDLDPTLEATVLRALAKDPAERFPNGEAFAAALEQAVPALGGATAVGTLSAAAPVAIAADTAPRATVVREHSGDELKSRRGAVVAAAAIVALVLASAGAWAYLRDDVPKPSVASASEGDAGKKRPRATSTDASGYADGGYVAATSSPRPSPSDGPEREEQDREERDRSGAVYRDYEDQDAPQEEPSQEPSPSESPTPVEEETTEPTPQPSDAEEPSGAEEEPPE